MSLKTLPEDVQESMKMLLHLKTYVEFIKDRSIRVDSKSLDYIYNSLNTYLNSIEVKS